MLTDEDVRVAYRLILGREPENEQTVQSHLRHGDLETFRRALFNSSEFREKLGLALKTVGQLRVKRAAAPPGEATGEQLSRLFERIRQEWTRLGEADPYWSVLTNERFRRERIDENRQAFFASGADDMRLLDAALARHARALQPGSVALELGCGVGRASVHLAARVARLHAYDISPGNLGEAERSLEERGITNVQLERLTQVEDYDDLPAFDLFFSHIVLQHNPPPVARHILERVVAKGRPGALLFFQIVTYIDGYRFEIESYLNTPSLGMEVHALSQAAVFEVLAAQGYRVLEVMEDNAAGSPRMLSQSFLAERG
jgi:2-polyprenyl-3-methyl-5-hydroxy-6-metoxy-1,4-benzoquinol methylase